MAYIYKPLPDVSKDIRITLLWPGEFYEEIYIEFRSRNLNVRVAGGIPGHGGHFVNEYQRLDLFLSLPDVCQNSEPEYEALSYVWGSTDNPS